MRKPLYHADPKKILELQRDTDLWRSIAHLSVMR